jgi:hypothetical protein
VTADFQSIQHNFTAYLRSPDDNPPPGGIEQRRLHIYRDLFYNNVAGFLAQGFPVLHQILTAKSLWHPLARAFFSSHSCSSPYFADIPGEFARFVSTFNPSNSPYPPYLAELAHYEWLEMVLDISTDSVDGALIDPAGDLLKGAPVINPVHRLVQYQWPVTTISADHEPAEPLPTPMCLLLFRDLDFRVHFIEINEPTHLLLAQLASEPGLTGEQYLCALSRKMPHIDPQQLFHFGAELLADFLQRGCILGAAKTIIKKSN